MDGTWHFLINGECVEIHVRSSCGVFVLSTLPMDWRQQFRLPNVRDAILAELTARAKLDWPNRRHANGEAEAGSIAMSWYSVRARLVPATLGPIGHSGHALDGRALPGDVAMPPVVAAEELTIPA